MFWSAFNVGRLPVLLGLASVAFSAGCRSTDGLSEEGRRIRAKTYETVYTVGSHIPKKVVRGQRADSDDSANPVAVLEGEQAKQAVRTLRGRR